MGNSVQYTREIKAGDTATAVYDAAYIRTMFGTVFRSIGVCALSTRMIKNFMVIKISISQLCSIIYKHNGIVCILSDNVFYK